MADADLQATARELGLTVEGDVDWDHDRCFARLRRAIARNEPSERHCLAGPWKGRNVVVRWDVRDEDSFAHVTHAIAEVDPPLLLCFKVRPGDNSRRRVDEPWFDANYVVHTYDERVFARLAESARHGALATFRLDATAATFHVTDSFACVSIPSRTDSPSSLALMLDRASDLAAAIGAELVNLHDGSWHHDIRAVWRSVAEARRLGFDAERFAIGGTLFAADVLLALEAEHDNVATALELRLPEGASFGFQLNAQQDVGLLGRFLPSQDVRVGDREFDDAFVVSAADPDATKAKLQDRSVTRAFSELFADSARFRMGERTLFARWLTPLERADRIDEVLGHASTIARAFSPVVGRAPEMGPYR
jgi:hypothetical protein